MRFLRRDLTVSFQEGTQCQKNLSPFRNVFFLTMHYAYLLLRITDHPFYFKLIVFLLCVSFYLPSKGKKNPIKQLSNTLTYVQRNNLLEQNVMYKFTVMPNKFQKTFILNNINNFILLVKIIYIFYNYSIYLFSKYLE